jgi:hypothetical protein
MIMPVLLNHMFQNLSSTNYMEVQSVMGDFIGRIVTNLQLVCHFIDSCHSLVENQHVDLVNVPFSHQCGQMPRSFIIATYLPTSEHVNPPVHALLQQNTVTTLC